MKKKTVKKHRFRSLIVIILFIYLMVTFVYYCFNLPVKNIYVIGNFYLSDTEIIETSGLKNYPAMTKVHPNKIKKNLEKLDLVQNAKIKRNILGKVTIQIEENIPLFIYRSDNLVYLSNGKTTKDNDMFLGIPYLVNYTPKEKLQTFIKKFSQINPDVISLISEIYYDPETKDDISIDDERFLLKMNDGNSVYVNIVNLKRLNNYEKIFATIDEGLRGILYLNSNRENVSFTSYDSMAKSSEEQSETQN